MKKIFSLIVVTVFLVFSLNTLAQTPPHPTTDPSAGGNLPVGGSAGAPIGSGLVLMLAMSAAYGLKKVSQVPKKNEDESRD